MICIRVRSRAEKLVWCERQPERILDIVDAGSRRMETRVVVRSDAGRGFATVGQMGGNLALEKRKEV